MKMATGSAGVSFSKAPLKREADATPSQIDRHLKKIRPSVGEALDRALSSKKLGVKQATELLRVEGLELQLLVLTANWVRHQLVGDVVTYVVNRNINHSNICVGTCRFCAFRRPLNHAEAYVLNRGQIVKKVQEAVERGATEVCIQGGLHPSFGIEHYLNILQAVREVSSTIHIHAFSPAELDHIARREGLRVQEVIKTLHEAGLDSVPGTAAEILVERVRKIICPNKLGVKRWMEIITTCHRLGLPTTATMLYGTIETPKERAEHLVLLRSIQTQTWGFTEFVPLAFMPYQTALYLQGKVSSPPSLTDSLRLHAVARLVLARYINHIQASWVKLGPRGAQLMLLGGADDLGGTLLEENITRAAGGKLQAMAPQELERLALEVGRTPRRRTTTYELL